MNVKRALRIGSRIIKGTVGSILFITTGGKLGQDNDKLFWNNTDKRLGINTNTPSVALDVIGSGKFSVNVLTPIIKTDTVTPTDLSIITGNNKTLVLNTSVWDDIQFPINSGRVPAANFPDYAVMTTNTRAYKFAVDDYIDLGSEELFHYWKQGTLVYPHIHIALDGANASGSSRWVKFTLYIAYADTSEVWTETSKNIEIEIPNGTIDLTHLLGESSSLDFTALLIGAQIKMRVKRIAATSGTEYPNHIFITQVGIHVEKDTLGSRSISTK